MKTILPDLRLHGRVKVLAVAMLALPLAGYSVTVTQTVDSASSSTDWNTALWGAPADVPAGGTDYIMAPGLRSATPTRIGAGDASAFARFYASSSAFAGDSLTAVDGTEILLKQTANEPAEANIILDGGSLRLSAGSSALATVTGIVHVATESWLGVADLGTPVLTFGSTLTGSEVLHIASGLGSLGSATVRFTGDLSGFSGTLAIGGGDVPGTVDFDQDYNLPNVSLSIIGADVVNLDQDLTFLALNEGTSFSMPVGTWTATEINDAYFGNTVQFVGSNTVTVLSQPYPSPEPPEAGIVVQVASAGSSDSWNGPAIWPAGATTSSTNDYFSSPTAGGGGNNVNYFSIGGYIRALNGDAPFGGKSLTIVDDTELLVKGSDGSSAVCSNLILTGGMIRYAPNSASAVTLEGGLTIGSNSVIAIEQVGSSTFTIASTLHGSADLSLRAGRTTQTLVFSGDLSDYSGTMIMGDGQTALTLDFDQNYDLPDLNIVIDTSNTNFTDTLTLDQTVKVNTFKLGDVYLAPGSAYTGPQLDSYFGVTNFVDNGGTLEVYRSTVVVPTVDPDITSITVAGGSATLEWISEPEVTYSILQKSNLSVGDWTPVKSNIVAISTNTVDSVPVSGSVEFYQIKGE